MTNSWPELLFYLLLYSLAGWLVEAAVCAVWRHKFVNRGILNLPFRLSSGLTMTSLAVVLPTVADNGIIQFIITVIYVNLIDFLTGRMARGILGRNLRRYEEFSVFSGTKKGFLIALSVAMVYYAAYLVIHPFVYAMTRLIPDQVLKVVCLGGLLIIIWDFITTVVTMRRLWGWEKLRAAQKMEERQEQRRFDRISKMVWNRLERAYPGMSDPELGQKQVFAHGVCFDKLVWVFLISAFLGDIIETVYCRIVGGTWMSRSSVIYGHFSLVWGIGAVLLTVILQRLADKSDRYSFIAGFVVGGVYEYTCSVFTEVVLGTTFWDYSWMPFNIGGRTNLLYCFFWGILAVFWIKICYPPMSRTVEKIPPLTGKVVTWAVILLMSCNALISAAAMVRYTQRLDDPLPDHFIQEFLDETYPDELIEEVWPNMKVQIASAREEAVQ